MGTSSGGCWVAKCLFSLVLYVPSPASRDNKRPVLGDQIKPQILRAGSSQTLDHKIVEIVSSPGAAERPFAFDAVETAESCVMKLSESLVATWCLTVMVQRSVERNNVREKPLLQATRTSLAGCL